MNFGRKGIIMQQSICVWQWIRENHLSFLKYLFSFVLILLACLPDHSDALFSGIIQLGVIILVTDVLLRYSRHFQYLNDLVMLVFNTEYILLYFANSFITLTMLDNVDSMADLSGKAAPYVIGVMAVVFISLMPVIPFGTSRNIKASFIKLSSAVILQMAIGITFFQNSMLGSIVKLNNDYHTYLKMREIIDSHTDDPSYNTGFQDSIFYKPEVQDYIAKPASLPEKPNIILVFAEGLSSNIIHDERNIMPNLAAFEKESISYYGYYNHTFATYHALQGQLFSGFQFDNYDRNHLVSIQKILHDENYASCFINTEPSNEEFSSYLNDLGFDLVISSENLTEVSGLEFVSDAEAYQLLLKQAEQMSWGGQPFLLSMYSFGTHVSLDSPDEIYGDGSDPLLNKFFNLDVQVGQFLEQFRNSQLYDNTIVVFTADHATYQDQDFSNSFSDYYRAVTVCDEMPLYIYHKDVSAAEIDVHGKTTIDLVPTILDYLDVSGESCFMGESLFNEEEGQEIEYVSWNSEYAVRTKDGEIVWITDEELDELNQLLQQYFILYGSQDESAEQG